MYFIKKEVIGKIVSDILMIGIFILITVFAKTRNFPLYVIEPMRIILIITIIFTNKANQYFFAIILPLISFFISGHPPIPKTLIIVCELSLNVAFFWLLEKKIGNIFLSIALSIILSKISYYIIKYIVFSFILREKFTIENDRIFEQVVIIVGLSVLGWFMDLIRKKVNEKKRTF
jgi:hypothetical protein